MLAEMGDPVTTPTWLTLPVFAAVGLTGCGDVPRPVTLTEVQQMLPRALDHTSAGDFDALCAMAASPSS